jgi:hypothetical protein
LIVDRDGTLLRTDTRHEMLAAALTHPRVLAGSALHFATRGKAGL